MGLRNKRPAHVFTGVSGKESEKVRGGRNRIDSWQKETLDRDMGISQDVGEVQYMERGEKEKKRAERSYWLRWEEKFFLRKRSSSCFPFAILVGRSAAFILFLIFSWIINYKRRYFFVLSHFSLSFLFCS